MNRMKLFPLVLALLMLAVGCTTAVQQDAPLRVVAIKGPTGMGMADLMERNATGESALQYEFTLVSTPEEAAALMIAGQADVAAVPTNLAAVLYKKTEGKVGLAAINTLGVLYILTNGDQDITSLADLAGKTVTLAGQGATPEYVLSDLLNKAGIAQDVTLDFRSEHAEVASLLLAGEADIVLLPEPQVTSTTLQGENVTVALDLNALFTQAYDGAALPMGCVVAGDALRNDSALLQAFLQDYAASVKAVNDDHAAAAQLIAKYGIVPAAPAAQKALPRSNIVCITGDDMAALADNFYGILHAANPAAVGGQLPDEGIYLK